MEVLLLILVPGVLGGFALAAIVLFLQRGGGGTPQSLGTSEPLQPVSTDMINMASIKVAGVGGLGLVAMSVAVAIGIPRIAQTEAVGIALGAIGAAVVILRRRRSGALPSSSDGMGANVMLRIDAPTPSVYRQGKPELRVRMI